MEFLGDLGGGVSLLFSYLLPFLFVLSIVIFVHELGHYLVGRWCGVRVVSFSIGFGKELLGYTDKHGTRWKISAIPLGGYVKFFGDANAASMPDHGAGAAMSASERDVSFIHKSVGQRAAIVAAGPIANFLLAIAIFAVTFSLFGRQVMEPYVGAVVAGSPAEAAGIKEGDLILSIDGRPIRGFEDVQRIVSGSPDETLTIVVARAGQELTLQATPRLQEISTRLGKHRQGILGLRSSNDRSQVRTERYNPVEAVWLGVKETGFVVERTMSYLGRLVTGRESADQLSGPVRIAQASGEVARFGGVSALISLAAILSISIGLINLFPVPLLDGGHLMFYAIEAMRRKPLSERAQELGFRIGFALVIMLMLFATWNDLLHLRSLWGT